MANAPEEVTVEQVVSTDEWTSRDGDQMETVELLFEGDGRTWKAHRPKTGTTAPAVGDVLRGWKNDGKGTFGIAKDRPQNGGGGRSGGGKNYNRSPDHPVQMQRALHTSALSTALPLIEQMLTLNLIDKPADKDAYLKLVEGVATWVQSTYPKAVLEQAAKADIPVPGASS